MQSEKKGVKRVRPVVFAHLQCWLEPSNLDGTNLGSCWCRHRTRLFGQRELSLPIAWKSLSSVACWLLGFSLLLTLADFAYM